MIENQTKTPHSKTMNLLPLTRKHLPPPPPSKFSLKSYNNLYQFAFKNEERSFEFMSDNDILRSKAHRRSELRRALVSEEGSLDGMKANRVFFILECEVLNHSNNHPAVSPKKAITVANDELLRLFMSKTILPINDLAIKLLTRLNRLSKKEALAALWLEYLLLSTSFHFT